ncbi:glycosyltransferase family 87 protein [uncultured Novosphingobium sp.]|uniref:glycosyltransferase family 87 protein n=1 Tax=uncultured Novosphingobium sp. TaxID=292277 RepID=UPI003749021A
MKLHAVQQLLINRWLAWVVTAPLVALLLLTTLQYRDIDAQVPHERAEGESMLIAPAPVAGGRILNDYEDFYIVGRLYREGEILRAYDNAYLTAAQRRFTGTTTFMPWAYPPQLTALTPLLPMVGLGWSYFAFMTATLMLFLWVLTRFGIRLTGAALLAIFPALLLVVRLGQNGMLTGALIGLFLLEFLRGRKSAGIPLGLMCIKPHLAFALGLMTLLHRRWSTIAIGMVIVVMTSVLATLVLGVAAWPAFFNGAKAAGGFLREGLFPLYRMSSIYAAARSFGTGPDTAMLIHIIGALLGLGTLVLAWQRRLKRNRLLALTAFMTLFVSPYNYDYDLVCLAFAVALILPEMLARATSLQIIGFYALAWVGTGAGLMQHFNAVLFAGTTAHLHGSALNWSFQAIGLIGAAILAAVILRQRQAMAVVGNADFELNGCKAIAGGTA